jgi:hypothetical protein
MTQHTILIFGETFDENFKFGLFIGDAFRGLLVA